MEVFGQGGDWALNSGSCQRGFCKLQHNVYQSNKRSHKTHAPPVIISQALGSEPHPTGGGRRKLKG